MSLTPASGHLPRGDQGVPSKTLDQATRHSSQFIFRLVAACLAITFVTTTANADAAESLARARSFLAGLSQGQKAIASAEISAPDRSSWSYLPGSRPGLCIAELDEGSRRRLDQFLTVALGPRGVSRALRIRRTEPVEERNGGVKLGPDEFRIRFFGLTGEGSPPAWAWRFEGHHLSLHQTIVGAEVVSTTPIFLGSVVREDERGEPLGAEDARAEAILESIPKADRPTALDPRKLPGDLRTAMLPEERWRFEGGLSLDRCGAGGRVLADAIVDDLLSMHSLDSVAGLRRAWKDTADTAITFAWCGEPDRRRPHQWRLESPLLIVEFSHSGGNVEHGHLVLRTRGGEFSNRSEQAWRDRP
ncbi:MAG: DUF3500 domain-containing protein [Phycisphaera sp.]|nr:DUF3500 domain-containing protein [Phycisphaera sp.]